jgi:hypothetical protein
MVRFWYILNHQMVASFAGIWSEKDVKEFEVNTADMNSVNPEEWR